MTVDSLDELRVVQARQADVIRAAIPRNVSADTSVEHGGTPGATERQLRLAARTLAEPLLDLLDQLEIAQAVYAARRHVAGLRGDQWVDSAASHAAADLTARQPAHAAAYDDGTLSLEREHAPLVRSLRGLLVVIEAADDLARRGSTAGDG